MKKYLFILLTLLISTTTFAQKSSPTSGYVEGVVMDKKTKEPVYSAVVSLRSVADSTLLNGIMTDTIGYFRIGAPKGDYALDISLVGYDGFSKRVSIGSKNEILSLDTIYIQDKVIHLGEAVITAEVPSIVNKGDTIEYNANSFVSEENAVLRDLINEIPGLEVDDEGRITANGKPVNKILVDGKEFFGNDIPLALANLPANMIKKLQIFKEDSKTAKITGFKEQDQDQTLNLVVKDELKQSLFGNIKAGHGSSGRYTSNLVANYMRGETQAALVGNLGNVSEFPGFYDNGESKNQNLGTNIYFEPVKDMKIGTFGRFGNDQNQSVTTSTMQTYLEDGDRWSKSVSSNLSKQQSFNFGFNLSWDIDSLTYIYANSSVQLGDNISQNRSSNISYVENLTDTTSANYDSWNRSKSHTINSSLTFGRRFSEDGRSISLSLQHSTRRGRDKGTNNSLTEYTNDTTAIDLDQQSKAHDKNDTYGITFSYIEPLGKDNRLRLSYSINNNKMNRDRNTWKPDLNGDYLILDSAYTRETDNRNTNQSISLEFQRTREKYDLTLGFSVDPSYSRSSIWMLDSLVDEVKQNVVNYSPDLRFSYRPNDNSSFDITYNGRTSQASTNQLSADTTILNASNKYYGNPDLKPSYSNRLNLNYQKSDYEIGRFMMISAGFDYTLNSIANYTLIDAKGNTENSYRNVNGNMGANAYFMYNTPLKNKKITISTYTNANYTRYVGFTNTKKAITNSIYLTEGLAFNYKDKKFTGRLSGAYSYNLARNSLSKANDRSTSTYRLTNNLTFKLPYDFSIRSDIQFNYYAGFGEDFKKSEFVWNAYIEKNLLKDKKGTIRLQIFDILNDRNSLRRTTTSNYSSDSYTKSINRYMMLTFSYRFNSFGGGGSDPSMMGYPMM